MSLPCRIVEEVHSEVFFYRQREDHDFGGLSKLNLNILKQITDILNCVIPEVK